MPKDLRDLTPKQREELTLTCLDEASDWPQGLVDQIAGAGELPTLHIVGASDEMKASLANIITGAMPAIRDKLNTSLLTERGSLIAGVLEARARSYDHQNMLVLPQDKAKMEASQALYQARMQRQHPELRKLNRTPDDEARLAAAAERRGRKAAKRAKP